MSLLPGAPAIGCGRIGGLIPGSNGGFIRGCEDAPIGPPIGSGRTGRRGLKALGWKEARCWL